MSIHIEKRVYSDRKKQKENQKENQKETQKENQKENRQYQANLVREWLRALREINREIREKLEFMEFHIEGAVRRIAGTLGEYIKKMNESKEFAGKKAKTEPTRGTQVAHLAAEKEAEDRQIEGLQWHVKSLNEANKHLSEQLQSAYADSTRLKSRSLLVEEQLERSIKNEQLLQEKVQREQEDLARKQQMRYNDLEDLLNRTKAEKQRENEQASRRIQDLAEELRGNAQEQQLLLVEAQGTIEIHTRIPESSENLLKSQLSSLTVAYNTLSVPPRQEQYHILESTRQSESKSSRVQLQSCQEQLHQFSELQSSHDALASQQHSSKTQIRTLQRDSRALEESYKELQSSHQSLVLQHHKVPITQSQESSGFLGHCSEDLCSSFSQQLDSLSLQLDSLEAENASLKRSLSSSFVQSLN